MARACFLSLHALAKLDQQLVGRLKANQTGVRVLDVEYNVDDHDRNDRETENVKPTPVWTACHPLTGQQGADEPKTEQKGINNPWRVDLQHHRAGGGDVNHVVERQKQQLAPIG